MKLMYLLHWMFENSILKSTSNWKILGYHYWKTSPNSPAAMSPASVSGSQKRKEKMSSMTGGLLSGLL
jgi:hypothetical protein